MSETESRHTSKFIQCRVIPWQVTSSLRMFDYSPGFHLYVKSTRHDRYAAVLDPGCRIGTGILLWCNVGADKARKVKMYWFFCTSRSLPLSMYFPFWECVCVCVRNWKHGTLRTRKLFSLTKECLIWGSHTVSIFDVLYSHRERLRNNAKIKTVKSHLNAFKWNWSADSPKSMHF